MMAIEKSLFEHHSNNYCGQDSRMYAKTIEWKFKEKQNSCIASMYLPPPPEFIKCFSGFNIYPQILWYASLQKMSFISPDLEC